MAGVLLILAPHHDPQRIIRQGPLQFLGFIPRGAIQFRVDGTFELPDRSDELEQVETVRVKLYIDGFFLAIISSVCLYSFFTAHG